MPIQLPDPNSETATWLRAIGLMLFAGIAGALGFIVREMDAGGKIYWPRVLLEFASAAFVGLLVVWLCQEFKVSYPVTGIATGVFGWLGAKASIQVLQNFVWTRLGLNRRAKDETASSDK